MPFDVAAEPVAVIQSAAPAPSAFEARDPDPAWAAQNPDLALAFLFLSPRPCDALDQLLAA
jgi:hypothetical protein